MKHSLFVCDASPLIFLAKLDALGLLSEIPGGELVVLDCVCREVLARPGSELERKRLDAFFQKIRLEDYLAETVSDSALSQSDRSTLFWALEHQATGLIADERLLRRVAQAEGLRVIGFLGVLIEAVRRGLMSSEEVKRKIQKAIRLHDLRISVALYQRILSELGAA